MRYIAIQRPAAEEIASNRLMQSPDFAVGRRIAQVLCGESDHLADVSPRLDLEETDDGRVITFVGSSSPQFVVFDLETSGLFCDQSAVDAMQCLQKVARFALKYWDNKVPASGEMIYPSYRRAVIFPFPISTKTGYRIAIDLDPDGERLGKRGLAGRYMLVYKAGTEEGQGPKEASSLTVFRKFLDDVSKVQLGKLRNDASRIDIPSFQNISVAQPSGRLDIHQGYDAWMRVLTDDQRRFVQLPISSPARIEGPAGTGKTLSLALKAVYSLKAAEAGDEENSSLFVTHSEASRRSILTVLESMGAACFLNPVSPRRALKVQTLQGLCADILKQDIATTELLDADAYDAKQLQLLYIEDAYKSMQGELLTYAKFMSPEFLLFIREADDVGVVQMLQHEISVVIKGRANEQFDLYKRVPPLKVGLPVQNEGDKSFVWRVYELYRGQLIAGAQFDTDDVMLSALGQLNTPIWRRRRAREGFDNIFIDETHLFNMNELSVFHNLTKRDDAYHIVFAIDRSQAVGDRGWGGDTDLATLLPEKGARDLQTRTRVSTVFRSSPEIVNLAFSVTSSGANLFTNFEDPLQMANSNMSFEEERMCAKPIYLKFTDDSALVDGSFSRADSLVKEMPTTKGNVAIIAFSDELFRELIRKAGAENKPIEVLKERGNSELVKRAQQSGRYVLSMPDYVGGLEFDAVVLVGVDGGRVPPSINTAAETRAFLNFTAHNRLYVAITRARYRVEILGVMSRGPSDVLHTALKSGALIEPANIP